MPAASMASHSRLAAEQRETRAQLLLAQALLASDEPVECAQATVDWLGARAGARRCVCALMDPERGRVTAVVTYGMQMDGLELALEEPGHPLIFAFAGQEAVAVKGRGQWRRDFLALPLPPDERREARLGLLLVSPSRVAAAHWAARMLGEKLARLQAQREMVEQAFQLNSQFLANMSHEFRTPLNAILGYTSMLLAGVSGPLQPPQKQKLLRVDSNGKRLLAIVNDILDISRIESGKVPVSLEEFDLRALFEELLADLPPRPDRLQIASELPPGPSPMLADRAKVKQILFNLLTNAVKFTPQGTVTISLAAAEDPREVRISVADTGIGIAVQDQEKIFEDFRQVDNSVTRQYGGTGLGLSICRRLANMLDGRIELRSEVGRGSTFSLVIPRTGERR
jgi:two-component system cell cycle sensor histidine kinase PleC